MIAQPDTTSTVADVSSGTDRLASRAERDFNRPTTLPSSAPVSPSAKPTPAPTTKAPVKPAPKPRTAKPAPVPVKPKATATKRATPRPSPSKRVTTPATGGTRCQASYYDTGSITASGEPFNPDGLTAAHRTLSFGTRLKVTNVANGKTVIVRINDRGPFVGGRCLDLSRGAFASISSLGAGVATIRYQIL